MAEAMVNDGLRNRRGMVLAYVMLVALVAAISAFVVLMIALSQARQARWYDRRTLDRYLAEGGAVIAREQLWVNPGYAGGTYYLADTNRDGVVDPNDIPVAVTVTATGPSTYEIQARADY